MTPEYPEDDRWHCARCGAVTSMLGHPNGCPDEKHPLTPERLAECPHTNLWWAGCVSCGARFQDIIAAQRTHIRDLEAQMWKLEWSGRTKGAPYSMGGPPVGSAPSCPFCHGLKPGLDAPRALGMSADQEGHRADCWYVTATPPSPGVLTGDTDV